MKTGVRSSIFQLLFVVLVSLATSASATPKKTAYSTVDLLIEQESVPADGGTITLGLYLKPDPTWHTYWINPGDAGMAPSVKWMLPDGFEAGELMFPAPHVLPFGELNTYAYEEELLLLTEVTVPGDQAVGSELIISGAASWVVCDDKICIPEKADLLSVVYVGDGGANNAVADQFAAARDLLPQWAEWPAEFELKDGKVAFYIAPDIGADEVNEPYLFVESKKLVEYDEQIVSNRRNGLVLTMPVSSTADGVESTRAILAYTDSDGEHKTAHINLVPGSGNFAAVGGGSDSGIGIFKAVVFAFLGGVILNLMPCVFPILSMKMLSLVTMGQQDQRVARESGVIYTAGILVAFAALGAALLGVRAAGDAVGWGFQMQNPLINVGLGLLMVAIAMNLLGVFEIGTRVMGVGQGLTEGGERKSAFFTGLLAVVVATPCTAPFMGVALGYALAQPPAASMSVFLALGFGLAFPYLALSFVPALGRIMPKPGAWMETFKHFLAFPMIVTALWLFWVVGKQLGATSMSVALLAAVALSFALWAYGKGALSGHRGAWYVTAAVGLIACGVSFSQVEANKFVPRAAGDVSAGTLGGLELEYFDPDRLTQYVADGQPTFVYFTADWCISCKANERVALATDEVAEAFNSRGIKVVEGDWTTEDPAITEWLARYDRAGVPLYLYFPRGSSLDTAAILPQVLTSGIVIDAIVAADTGAPLPVPEKAIVEEKPPYRIPDAEPDWEPVQYYIDIDAEWHELDNEIRASDDTAEEKQRRLEEELGPHPEIEDALAAAVAIVKSPGGHDRAADAAEFLVVHPYGFEGYTEAALLGANWYRREDPNYNKWTTLLTSLDFVIDPGASDEFEDMLVEFGNGHSDPKARAAARYYLASRNMRLGNAVGTPHDEREGYHQAAIGFATDLSSGIEDVEFMRRERFDADGNRIPDRTFAEYEEDLLYNLNFLSVGQVIPDLAATNLAGTEETIASYRGETVLLDFWATWCGPCIASIPKMIELDETLPEDEFEILSISVDEDLAAVIEFQEGKPMPWANWHVGPRSQVLQDWAVRGYPTYILIDREGRIVARQHDLTDNFADLVKVTTVM